MKSDSSLHRLTVAKAADLIRRRKLSPLEYVDALLERIEALDGQIHSFITVTADRAREHARQAEAEIAAGRYRGPLHGIPYALKDVYSTQDILTSGGSRTRLDNVPTENATAARKAQDAGAILLGKLQTHEFAHGGPSFDLPWPPARNPWNLEHFTGGSSSGAGAALAARLVPAALGTDTGGSIRGPAALCGITGFKPTYGLVSRAGVLPNSFTMDHCGPMGRTVEDCAILLQTIAGFDPTDAASVLAEIPDYRAALTGDIRGLRMGVLRHGWEKDAPVSPQLAAAMESAVEQFRRLGAHVEDCRTRSGRDLRDIKTIIGETEIFSIYAEDLRRRTGDFGRDFLGRILPACLFQSVDYVQASREHRRVIRDMSVLYERYDILLAAGAGPAPRLDAHRTSNFWEKPNAFTLANVTGGPSLALPVGFSAVGLPLGMQLTGRPFDDALVLRAGHAYQQTTDWHTRCPELRMGAEAPVVTPTNNPVVPDLDASTRTAALASAQRAGLELNEIQTAIFLECAPHALAMSARMRRPFAPHEEPALVVHFPGHK
ncbi:MAG: amidase [Betaproteobacteria bacterium]|nr:amidase [Betaproteobacteria bacterium]